MTTAEPKPGREADETTGVGGDALHVRVPSPRVPESPENPDVPDPLDSSDPSDPSGSFDDSPGGSSGSSGSSTAAGPPGPAGPSADAAALEPPSTRARRLLRHPVTIATAAAAVGHLLWFFFLANTGGDIAAQDAWAEFVGRHPGTAYNLAWYGGMHPVSYSVVSPYLMSLLGVRTTMMIVGTVSSALTALILVRVPAVRNPLACSLAGVFAFLCNALSGRVTFGLGMMFAVGSVAAVFCWPHRWRYKRWAKAGVAAPLAALATASSPVAGLFLGVVAAALFLHKRRPGAYAVGLAPVAVVGLSSWLFPFSGTQPMSLGTLSLPFLFAVLVYVLVPRDWSTVRTAAAVYGVGTLLTYVIDSQIGSNITRMAMLFAGVALLAALPYAVPRSRRWYALVLAFVGLNFWIGFKGVDDIVRTAPAASWNRELAPLVNQLQQVGAERGRVEVVPASSHRESSVASAPGWRGRTRDPATTRRPPNCSRPIWRSSSWRCAGSTRRTPRPPTAPSPWPPATRRPVRRSRVWTGSWTGPAPPPPGRRPWPPSPSRTGPSGCTETSSRATSWSRRAASPPSSTSAAPVSPIPPST
ncbi:Integral membrane protein OS=Streptomyces griseus OX=1911 GN=NCTC13033_06832 PE=4 SV=1 [Streptomyces griseus subsp. griseus]